MNEDRPMAKHATLEDPEPRWPALIAILASGAMYTALSKSVAPGPDWLVPVIVGTLCVPVVLTHRAGAHKANVLLGHLLSAVLTIFLLISVALLIITMVQHKATALELFGSATILWITNVVVFSLWYWRLDAGGPHAREAKSGHETGAFLFPQMTLDGAAGCERDGAPWSPRFVDYFFVAFNTSTAFSPTDVPVLSRWAKLLSMTQAAISLAVVAVLVGRAVNIL